MKLKGKIAVITGAGAGYGMSRGFPTIYAKEGANLVLNYYGDSEEKINELKKELEGYGAEVYLVEGDISKAETAEKRRFETHAGGRIENPFSAFCRSGNGARHHRV